MAKTTCFQIARTLPPNPAPFRNLEYQIFSYFQRLAKAPVSQQSITLPIRKLLVELTLLSQPFLLEWGHCILC